jgi:hypothetical protein
MIKMMTERLIKSPLRRSYPDLRLIDVGREIRDKDFGSVRLHRGNRSGWCCGDSVAIGGRNRTSVPRARACSTLRSSSILSSNPSNVTSATTRFAGRSTRGGKLWVNHLKSLRSATLACIKALTCSRDWSRAEDIMYTSWQKVWRAGGKQWWSKRKFLLCGFCRFCIAFSNSKSDLLDMSRRGFGGRGRGRGGGRSGFGGFDFSALGTTYQEVMSQPRDPEEAYPVSAF